MTGSLLSLTVAVADVDWWSQPSTTNKLYFALLVVAALTFLANIGSAVASLMLSSRQKKDADLREAASRPNVQMYDYFIENIPNAGVMTWQNTLTMFITNVGLRPAKIIGATFSLLGETAAVEIRSASLLRANESARIEIDLNVQQFRDATGSAIDQYGPEEMLRSEFVLTVRFTEADGTNESSSAFAFPFHNVRFNFASGPATLRVVRDERELRVGDRRA